MKRSDHDSVPRLQVLLALSTLFLFGVLTVRAQATPTPVTIGENTTGQVTDSSSTVQFAVTVGAPQSINIEVLAITPGFAPTFQVLDPGGIVVLDTANPGTLSVVQGTPNLSSPGEYTIVVSSANAALGQFLISVQAGAPLAPPQALTPGQPVNGSVDAQNTRAAYQFSALADDVLLLTVRSASPTSGPVVALRDADTGETLGLTSGRLAGADYRVAMGAGNYLLEVTHSGSPGSEDFVVCLATESGSATCPGIGGAGAPQSAAPAPPPITSGEVAVTPTELAPAVINPNGQCEVVSARGQSVNVRSSPSTTSGNNVVTQLPPNGVGIVIGRLPDNTWFEINVNGVSGWVSGSVVTVGGICSGVSVVILPTSIPPTNTPTGAAPTNTPTETPTLTLTPTEAPTSNGTPHIHVPPIGVLTLVAPIQIVPVNPRLDYTASANYGEANLSAGFSPDPYSVGMTTGGGVDVSYLGGSCSGFATTHPDLRINFGGGGASLLRIYFVGSNGDATMVVNDPYGNFYCVDDSFGTVNPTIDFNNPAGGTYDVWIGSYAANTTISGTLYLTENSGNHP